MTAPHPRSVRALDVCLSCVLLALSAPLWPVIAMAVKVSSPGPVLFRGKRMLAGGEPFAILKFRTMRFDPGGQGSAVTAGGDSRVTSVGRVLRLTKADELPQLVNVLRGEMALVGPRPEDPRYRDAFGPDIAEVLAYRPGVTGPASLAYRHEEELLGRCRPEERDGYYRSVVLPAKARMDLDYLQARSVRTDLQVLVATVGSVLRHRPDGATAA